MSEPPNVKITPTLEEIIENSKAVISDEFSVSYLGFLLGDKTLTEQIATRDTVEAFSDLLRKVNHI